MDLYFDHCNAVLRRSPRSSLLGGPKAERGCLKWDVDIDIEVDVDMDVEVDVDDTSRLMGLSNHLLSPMSFQVLCMRMPYTLNCPRFTHSEGPCLEDHEA